MIYKILLVGAGNIGSRYLQGLKNCKLNLEITVIDASEVSLNKAKFIWNENKLDDFFHKISWLKKIPENSKYFHLAIIATPSRDRAILIQKIKKIAIIDYWIIEKVLEQSKYNLNLLYNELSKSKKVWVNTPRRQMDWYKKIKNKLYNLIPLRVEMNGGLWGLACNSIHFIDLISWWTGENIISIDSKKLDSKWIKSKRTGYFEITGDLIVKYSSGTELLLRSSLIKKNYEIKVELPNNDYWLIDETKGIAVDSKNVILEGKLELQSEMTGPLIAKILTEGNCELAPLKQSVVQHEFFLDVMLNHWNNSNNFNDKQVPIT